MKCPKMNGLFGYSRRIDWVEIEQFSLPTIEALVTPIISVGGQPVTNFEIRAVGSCAQLISKWGTIKANLARNILDR